MMNKLEKLYDRFSAKERFKLTLAAWARGDMAESERLQKYCPQQICRMADAAYTDRLEKMRRIARRFLKDHTSISNNIAKCWLLSMSPSKKVKFVDMMFNLVVLDDPAENQEMACARKNGRHEEMPEMHGKIEECSNKYFENLKELHEGFKLFCLEADIDYQNAVDFISQSIPFGFTELEFSGFDEIEASTETVEEIKTIFLKLWE